MKFNTEYQKNWRSFFILAGFLLIFILGLGWYKVLSLNNSLNTVNPSDSKSKVTIDLTPVKTDVWQTLIQINESPTSEEVFIGETRSCTIINNSKYSIKDWNLVINIKQDCYLNGFWCGDFEIHQFRNEVETVERINNSTVDIHNLKLECNNQANNLMVHLIPGDYLVYCPSAEANENIVKANNSVGIGYIFYYQETLDLSDYSFTYYRDIKLIETAYFRILILLTLCWVIGLIFFHFFLIVNRNYMGKVNNSIKSISVMADMYMEMHMINLNSSTGYLIKGKQDKLLFNFIGIKVDEYFKKYIEEDCCEDFKTELTTFLDLNSIKEMLNSVSSISFEYKSKKQGWCSLRFFKLDSDYQQNQLILTVQDINKEKEKQYQEQEQMKQFEYSQMVRNAFLDTITVSTNGILDGIENISRVIQSKANTEEQVFLANSIVNSIEHYKLLQNCAQDMFSLEGNVFKLKEEKYNLYELVDNLLNILKPFYENKQFEFQKSIDAGISETLEGDKTRLMQILMLLLVSAFFITEKGFVKLSIFAKKKDDYQELLFSIRDSGSGFTKEQVQEVYSFLEGSRINSFDNPSLVYLKIIDGILGHMGSELKMISELNSGTEFYFTVKQKIAEKVE